MPAPKSTLLYFVPTPRKELTPADLRQLGLSHLLDGSPGADGNATVRGTRGPGDAEGLVFAADGSAVDYVPDRQQWRKGKERFVEGQPAVYWAGIWTDRPKPGPAELARPRQYPGAAVTLLDGREWLVPRCYGELPERLATLPRVLDVAEDGETVLSRPHPRFADLCERAFTWFMQWSGLERDEAKHLTAQQEIALAVDGLAVNYRIGKLEAIALLGLLGTDERGLILRAMIDADEIEAFWQAEAQKKSTSAASGSTTSSGVTGASPLAQA